MAESTASGAGKAAQTPTAGSSTTGSAAPAAPSIGATDTTGSGAEGDNVATAKSRFGKAVEEARAGAEALRDEAMQRGTAYKEKLNSTTGHLGEDARAYADQAREKAASLARDGKTRASDALAAVGRTIADTASTVDEKLGPQYGDYARNAARWTQETAAKLEAKDLNELGDDVKEFVRKSPGMAIGIAAVAGFVVARMLGGGSGNDRSSDD